MACVNKVNPTKLKLGEVYHDTKCRPMMYIAYIQKEVLIDGLMYRPGWQFAPVGWSSPNAKPGFEDRSGNWPTRAGKAQMLIKLHIIDT